ncbi:rod shape-determining protein RodA [Zunongwangia sp.]|uniref:rod shape-determining protein RodA n=1 Tax=Zunongwangia sp. TaxID=1965325 RepID=UPI003AA8B6CB
MGKNSASFDWVTILIYLSLVCFGWVNIYSASLGTSTPGSYLDMSEPYGRQALFIGLSVILIIVILAIEAKFYQRFSSIIYIIALIMLAGLFVFGKTISGATSWYAIGTFRFQPSEFAKIATALALAKYVSDIETNIKLISHQFKAFVIIALPALLIIPQPDPGSALVYAAFFFPLYREGISGLYFVLAISGALIFVGTLLFGPIWVAVAVVLMGCLSFFLLKKKKRPGIPLLLFIIVTSIGLSFSVNYIFNNIFEQRHRDRLNLVLGKEVDSRGIGYNTNQSEIAIGSGGWTGKGWTEGTQTKGHFVPEQHTDYIFSTVGEEWGFAGSSAVIILFTCLLFRLIFLAERQKSQFSRIYGYSVAGIIFIHFMVNIGMVLGIFPTVGIPLPLFSYGGSGLWGFTILLFIFIKLDSERLSF